LGRGGGKSGLRRIRVPGNAWGASSCAKRELRVRRTLTESAFFFGFHGNYFNS
jgi:hypothetical protein